MRFFSVYSHSLLFLLAVALLLYGAVAIADSEEQEAPPDLTEWGLEMITLNSLSYLYGPVEFTHKGHLNYTGGCTDCHHHSDPGEYPSCSSCHPARKIYKPQEGKNGLAKGDELIGLNAAYHQQCMGCHREFQSGPMGCTDCHAKIASPKLPDAEPKK